MSNKPARSLRLCHLYPQEMNTYADRGNIAVIESRLKWRNLELEVTPLGIGQELNSAAAVEFDFLYLGGGQDKDQEAIAQDLILKKKQGIKAAAEDGAVGLFVCGGYQLAGNSYTPAGEAQKELEGIGLLDVTTRAGNTRLIGDILISAQLGNQALEIVGYENHAGLSYIGLSSKPLGETIYGQGNNLDDKTEGAVSSRIVGTYIHGPLLPKNPKLADLLITWGLEHRYGQKIELEPLEKEPLVSTTQAARQKAILRARRRSAKKRSGR